MKIAAIAGSQIPSDTANSIQVMKACSALVQLGHDVTLLVPGNRKSEIVNLKSHYGLQTDFPIEWLASPSRRLFTWQAVQRARALSADLLYTWFPQSAVFGLLFHIPTVFEIHLQPTGALGPAWHRAFAALRGRKRLASITRALVDLLERRHNIRFHADEVVIAPNGVELERFASLPDPVTARRTLNLPPAPTVMCTGHLYAGRGADLFLALAKELPQAHFVWVGGRPADVEAWKARAESNNVTFTGFIPNHDLPLYQAAADILLMPYSRSIMGSSGSADSASVASPMKMFEYMAAGRAIVTADLPVIREVLNERNAVFCEPDEVGKWKVEIERLLADEPRRRSLGEQARQDVQGYTWLARAEKILAGLLA
ncbi:MAG: glycosyltransferase [Chloroflexota bacterium]|nr:glycosyltransferase [Chloroflexota bacterium]MBI5703143.1 glycosyltransferase [Chloroflexota bacterium]